MHFTASLTTLLGALTLTNALYVPQGTPDGIYDLTEDAEGLPILSKLGDLLQTNISVPPVIPKEMSEYLQKRADPGSYKCYPVTLIRNSIQRAAANLGNTCDTGVNVPKKGSQVAVAGDVVVYACNTARFTNKGCSSSSLNFYVDFLESNCPVDRAGQLRLDRPLNKGEVNVYGYTQSGMQLCKNI
ncbi:hypothetical protein KCU98_g712, partial [Aureobasidium melanogenum]